MEEKTWTQILSASDDMISAELLEWSNLLNIWQEHELDNDHDFMQDVAEYCDHIRIEKDEMESSIPSHNWTIYTVETDDETLLRQEMRQRIEDISTH